MKRLKELITKSIMYLPEHYGFRSKTTESSVRIYELSFFNDGACAWWSRIFSHSDQLKTNKPIISHGKCKKHHHHHLIKCRVTIILSIHL